MEDGLLTLIGGNGLEVFKKRPQLPPEDVCLDMEELISQLPTTVHKLVLGLPPRGLDNTEISANVVTLNKTYCRAFRTHYVSPHGLTKNKMQIEMCKSTGSLIKVHFNSSGANTFVSRILPILKSKNEKFIRERSALDS